MSEEKKIIIDEDWKTRVQAEKEAAAQHPPGEPAFSGVSTSKSADGSSVGDESVADPKLPPASFEMLVTTLATEALVALGQMPHPLTDKAELQPNHAQYLIDTLDVLRQKCQGNLTPGEQQLIESMLHQLRMVFVAVATQPASS